MQKIFSSMISIMRDVEPIAKNRENSQQKYKFRGIDDVYEALQAIQAKHGVFSVPTVLGQIREERPSKSGGLNIYSILTIKYTFYADDGSSVEATVIGEGMDSGDKASNKGMSVGHKYALLQAFSIPTRDPKDPENDSIEVSGPAIAPAIAPVILSERASNNLRPQTIGAPECCGKPMYISKYIDQALGAMPPFYCSQCKSKQKRESA